MGWEKVNSSVLILQGRLMRLLECVLPLSLFRSICQLGCFNRDKGRTFADEDRIDLILMAISNRLHQKKWLERCRLTADASFAAAAGRGEPIVLVFLHKGPYQLICHWLRAHGFRASGLMQGRAMQRPAHREWRDRLVRFPEQKIPWFQDELKDFLKMVGEGGVGLLALDISNGKQCEILLSDGRSFRAATGPFRLAENRGFQLYPCGLESLGKWTYHLKIGAPFYGDACVLIEELLGLYGKDPITHIKGNRLSYPAKT